MQASVGGAVVKNLPANARDTGSSPGLGRFPHATEQLSLRATTTEPACHNYWSLRAYSPCSATREATTMRSPRTAMKSSPRSPQLEKSPCAAMKTQSSQKKKKKKNDNNHFKPEAKITDL